MGSMGIFMKKPIKVEDIVKKKKQKVYDKILEEDSQALDEHQLTGNLADNEAFLRSVFKGCTDVVIRPFTVLKTVKAIAVYVEGLTDTKLLDEQVLKQLMQSETALVESRNTVDFIQQQIISVGKLKTINSLKDVVKSVLEGSTVLLVDGEVTILSLGISGGERRSISEPVTEVVIRGPREGFTEDLNTNISLLRRRLRTPRLKMESFMIGEISQTKVTMAYVQGIAVDQILNEVRSRIGRIKIDSVMESSYIEEFIEDAPFSIFPQVQNTERPDVVAASLLEGKIAILCDNTPFTLLVPVVFWGEIHSNEDYYEHFTMSTFLRIIRLIFIFIALIAPSFYVAITTFHQQMIPSKLLMSIIDNREPTPFPAVIEALIMEITFEALREAGIRLPKPVGQAVSIVGALVIGQAAVEAGLISAPMVIVVAVTGIASFTIPRYNFSFAVRVLRFPLIFLAGSFGMFGVTLGVIGIFTHLVNLRSFGVPYFSPVAPLNIKRLKDVFVRAPMWSMNLRPNLTSNNQNKVRVPAGQKPSPEQGKQK